MFILSIFPHISLVMILFATFCSYKQYYLNIDLSVDNTHSRYLSWCLAISTAIAIIIAYCIVIDLEAYRAGFQYSKQFLSGDTTFSFTSFLDLSLSEHMEAALLLVPYLMVTGLIFTIINGVMVSTCYPYKTNYDVKSMLANEPNQLPRHKKFYIFTERNASMPILFSFAIIISIDSFALVAQGEKVSNKYYSTDVQLSQPVLDVLQSNCEYRSAIYKDGELSCDGKVLERAFGVNTSPYDVIVVWNDPNSPKHEVLMSVPISKAPPTRTPESAKHVVEGILGEINEPLLKHYKSAEHHAVWKKLER